MKKTSDIRIMTVVTLIPESTCLGLMTNFRQVAIDCVDHFVQKHVGTSLLDMIRARPLSKW